MSTTWVLVADAARARLFELPRKGANLTEIACYTHPNGRTPGQHSAPDRLPRTQESHGPARHAIEPRTSLRDKHARHFADVLRDVVQRGRMEGRYDELILMAPSKFLGVLHERLDDQTLKHVVSEVAHDLIALSPAEVRAHLPA